MKYDNSSSNTDLLGGGLIALCALAAISSIMGTPSTHTL